jgi:hydroxymethylpyrimidine/phosphomethylpyrimidine kinase
MEEERIMSHPNVVTIAGSDPSGGAGIQADLKAFSALGAYGTTVVTALTAQNTLGVTGIHPVPIEFISQQWTTLIDDVHLDAVKIGMLGTREVVITVLKMLDERAPEFVVLDPVMVATSGDPLMSDDAASALWKLIPRVGLITPNLAEGALLLDTRPAHDVAEMRNQAKELHARGAVRVLLKGGHLTTSDQAVDVYLDETGMHELTAPWVSTQNTHGTGCSLSSAIAALRPQRATWVEAVTEAKQWLTGALLHASELSVGSGHGPVNHFYHQWNK